MEYPSNVSDILDNPQLWMEYPSNVSDIWDNYEWNIQVMYLIY
jgi:hypothetical protein